jgi:hypothetical protein
MATRQIPQLDPIRPARPFQLPSSRFDLAFCKDSLGRTFRSIFVHYLG